MKTSHHNDTRFIVTGWFARRAGICPALLLSVATTVSGLAISQPAQAASIYLWQNASTKTFLDPFSWRLVPNLLSPGVPGAGDEALFYQGVGSFDTYTLVFPTAGATTNQRAIVGGVNATFNLAGGTYNLTASSASSPSLQVGVASPAGSSTQSTLTLSNGTVNAVDTGVGMTAGYTGTLNVASGATLNNSDSMYVGGTSSGAGGTGILNVSSGGAVTADDTLKVWDNGSVNLAGGGTVHTNILSIKDGGVLNSSSGVVGTTSLPTGAGQVTARSAATVDGVGATWDVGSGNLNVGLNDVGTLTISNGGLVQTAGAGAIAAFSSANGSAVTVGGGANTSQLITTNGLYIGGFSLAQGGTGSLTVDNNGSVTVSNAPLKVWSTGTVDVNTGGGVVADELIVDGAFNSNGGTVDANSLAVNAGGTVTSVGGQLSNTAAVTANGTLGASTATVGGSGATWSLDNLYIGGTASAAGGTGALTVNAGGLVDVANTLKIWDSGTLTELSGGSVTGTTLSISGGTGSFASNLYLGENDNTLGFSNKAIVDGSGSSLSVGGTLVVSDGNNGSTRGLLVSDGAAVTSAGIEIGGYGAETTVKVYNCQPGQTICPFTYVTAYSANSIVEVTGSGSMLTTPGALTIGVTQQSQRFGCRPDEVHDPNCTRVPVSGKLFVSDGATVEADGAITAIGGNHSRIDLATGGTLVANNGLDVSDATLAFGGGNLIINGSSFTTGSRDLNLGANSTLQLLGATGSSGALAVGAGSNVQLQSGSTFTADNISIDGGSIDASNGGVLTSSGDLVLLAGGSLDISNGGSATAVNVDASGGSLNYSDGMLTINGGTYTDGAADLLVDGGQQPLSTPNPTLRFINGANQDYAGNKVTVGFGGSGYPAAGIGHYINEP